MRFIWKGKWKQGEITVETESLEELNAALKELLVAEPSNITTSTTPETQITEEYPSLTAGLGCSDAIRTLLQSEWGKKQPRSMSEIEKALQANALYFSGGTLSGTLNLLTKYGSIRRFKKDGRWAYVSK
jgi:uncharacterized membrane protein YheB (UPF0754 family)